MYSFRPPNMASGLWVPICSPVRATYATLKAAPPSSAQILYDAIIVSHDNMHLITGLYVISEPIHSSNVIRIITGWLHWEDDLTAAMLQREGCEGDDESSFNLRANSI